MAIYAKFGSIKGNVTTTSLEGWVELDNFRWGYATSNAQGQGSSVAVHEFMLTMKAEQASVDLAQFGLNRTLIGSLECRFTTTAVNKVTTYMAYKFTNCLISSYGVSADPHGIPVETFSFSFQAVNFSFSATDPKLASTPKSVTFDLTSLKTS